MAFLVWDPKYSVNIGEIDSQHQKLFALVNDLYEVMQEGLGRDNIGAALGQLIDYAAYHFAHEEKLFSRHGYAEGAAHRAGHAKLAQRLMEMKQKFDAGQTNVTLDMLRYVGDWLNDHIMGEDKGYVEFLSSRGVN